MLVQHRHGGLPDTDDRSQYLEAIAWCCYPRHGDRAFMLGLWCDKLGGAGEDEIQHAIETTRQRRRFTARQFGRLLWLKDAERQQLKIKTIEAQDVSPAKRARQRKIAHAKREELRRRAKGAKPRAEYLAASKSKNKPWQALGISRRTYYRRLAQVHVS